MSKNRFTNYERFNAEAIIAGARCRFHIGYLPCQGEKIRVEGWAAGDSSFILLIGEESGNIAFHPFAGVDGEPVENDIKRVRDLMKRSKAVQP